MSSQRFGLGEPAALIKPEVSLARNGLPNFKENVSHQLAGRTTRRPKNGVRWLLGKL
jgi:hypothetical protein